MDISQSLPGLPVLADLTELEQQVVTAAQRGELAKPAVTATINNLAVSDDPGVRVRADLIRELLLGRRGDLDPRGLRVQGVRLIGRLDLDHVTTTTGLALVECALPDGINCQEARLRDINLNSSTVAGILADGLHTDGELSLKDTTLTAASEDATVRLTGAHIGGQLLLDHAEITNTTGPALLADNLRTGADMSMEGAVLTGVSELGAVRLPEADICGQLILKHAEITNTTGPALLADNLRVTTDTFLRNATLRGASELGAVRLVSAHIGGRLDLDRAKVMASAGPALHADGLRTDDTVSLEGAALRGASELGAVRLVSAHVGGQLDLDRAEITNTKGPALDADRLRVNSDMFMRDAVLIGGSESGAVRLIGAHVGGQLDLDRAEITATAGPALEAYRLRTDDYLFLRDATLTAIGERPAVRLHSARIGGQVDMRVKQLSNGSGPLAMLAEAEIAGWLFLPASVLCPAGRTGVDRLGCPDGARQIRADGLVFPRLRCVSWQQWLHLLVHHTPGYWPQPFQHLAAVERAAGHDNSARQILITQQDDLRRRNSEALGGPLGYARHWLWGWLGRYGYRAHRLVTALALVLVIAAGLGYTAGQLNTRPGHHAAERIPSPTTTAKTPGTPCSTIELIGLGIDRGLPLGATGVRARCDLDTTTTWGQRITAAIWILQALVWALATLTIAAYTGLVRKPT